MDEYGAVDVDSGAALSTGPIPPLDTGSVAPSPTESTEPSVPAFPEHTVVRRRVGLSDLHVFPLALNGNVFGWTADAPTSDAVLDRFAAAGGQLVDTADAYAGGRSEIIIGNWMRSRRNREAVVVATKVGKGPDHPGVTSPAIAAAVHDSLRRLRTDRIDLLSLHVDDPSVDFGETLLAVDRLIRAGDVRWFGASHHSGDRLIEARIASAQLGVAPMVALQNQYNLVFRTEYEGGLERVVRDLRLGFLPRFGLAGGFLSGKYRTRADLTGGRRRGELGRFGTRTGWRVLAVLDEVAAEHEVSTAAIALAWLLLKPGVVAPVVSASAPDQVADLVAATTVVLTRQQLAALDRASA